MPRRGVAHAAQDRGVLRTLTVSEQLRLAAAAAAVPAAANGGGASDRRRGAGRRSTRTQLAAAVAAVVEQVPALAPLLERRGALLSGGEQQLLSVARALVARPRLLLVDELSLGLAPPAVSELLGVVRAAADAGAGVLLVEQFAPLALSVADRAYVLDRGRVVAAGRAEEIAERPELVESAYLGSPPSASSTPDSGGGGQA